jgi:hypothetical protein
METVAGATYYVGIPTPATPVPSFVSTVTVTYTAGPNIGRKESVVVPDSFPRRVSKDGAMHACIVMGRLQCLFVPPAM